MRLVGSNRKLKKEEMTMKLKIKKFAAFAMTAVMAVAFPASVSAEELGHGDEKTGVGEVEGSVKQDIYQVVLPTVTEDMFNFIIDPQGLINKTDGAAYDGKTFEEGGTLFFERKDGKSEEDYSSTSDAITITNRSSMAIDVSVEVSVEAESLEGITLTDDKEFQDDTGASLYLALTDGETVTPISTDGVSMTVTVDASPEGAYEYAYDEESGEYTYEMSSDLSGIEFPEYSFQLVGAANGKGDWSELTGAVPKIRVSWRIEPKSE